MQIEFNAHGNKKQLEACRYWIDNSVNDIVYGGSKGSGKSFLYCSLISGDALIYPGTHYFIARKRLNDIRKYTIPSMHEVMRAYGLDDSYYKYNGQDNFFEFYNGSKVFLLQAKYEPSDPHYYRFGSMQMTRGFIEEAGEFEEAAKNNLMASVGRWRNEEYGINGKIGQSCNPAKNYLYKKYYKRFKNGTLEDHKKFIQALPSDNKMLDSGYLDLLDKTLSPEQKQRLLFGNWEYDDDPTALCDYENILSIFENDHIYLNESGSVKDQKKYITADIARLGSDKAIIAVWLGWSVIEIYTFEISRTTEIQNAINSLRSKHGIATRYCIADEDGIGGGVVDNCRIKGFVNNSRPLEVFKDGKKLIPNYSNLQSQCAYHLAEKIQLNQIYIHHELSEKNQEEIIEELEQLKSFDHDKDGKLKILPKDKIKANIGRSPDWRDTLLMRSWFDLNPYSGRIIVR